MERRECPRYRLYLPVTLGWTDDGRVTQQHGGFTRDVSTGGVFVMCDAPPSPGTSIQFEMFLPVSSPEAPGIRVQGQAVVVRAEHGPPTIGFAAMGAFDLPVEEAEKYPTEKERMPT